MSSRADGQRTKISMPFLRKLFNSLEIRMDATLLDADVFSYLTKSNDPRANAYPHVKGTTVAISFITVGELYFGAEKKKWSGKTLNNFLERLKAFVVPYDIELCKTRQVEGHTARSRDSRG